MRLRIKFNDGTEVEFETREPWTQYDRHFEWWREQVKLAIQLHSEQNSLIPSL